MTGDLLTDAPQPLGELGVASRCRSARDGAVGQVGARLAGELRGGRGKDAGRRAPVSSSAPLWKTP